MISDMLLIISRVKPQVSRACGAIVGAAGEGPPRRCSLGVLDSSPGSPRNRKRRSASFRRSPHLRGYWLITFVYRYFCNHRRMSLVLAVLLLNASVLAQTRAPSSRTPPTPDLADANQEIFKWTNLLDKLALEARTLSEENLRPEALNAVADAYWELSPARSKELFSSALELALALETEKTRQAAVSSVIFAAAKRDAQFARALTKVLLESKNRNTSIRSSLDLLDLDIRTAELIAIAASSAGASSDSAWLIFQMQKRDPAAADRVYPAYLNNENSRSLNRLLWLAGYPFGNGESFGGAEDPLEFTGFSGFDLSALKANRALADVFLSRADQTVAATLSQANSMSPQDGEALNAQVFFTVSYLLPETEKYRPDLYVRWASLQNDIAQRMDRRHRGRGSRLHSSTARDGAGAGRR